MGIESQIVTVGLTVGGGCFFLVYLMGLLVGAFRTWVSPIRSVN